jgi:O-antigen biosynthesis protein
LDLSIVIVNYNVKYFLEHCLASVEKAIVNLQAEVFVVDNASSDGSNLFFKDRFPPIKFIYNEKNVGFAKANNQAVALCSGKYILFLNPDTLVPENCFEKCISFFESNMQCGALGVKMIDGAGNFLKESKRSFPSPLTSFYKLSGLAKLFPHSKKYANYHLGHLSENESNEVDVLAGAFMMIPKKVISEVGSFDEQFFMYGEDVDLSYRIQKAGYKNYYFADTTIIHFKGESTKRGSLNYVKMFYKAMSQFVTKHYGVTSAGVFNKFIQLSIFIRGSISGLGKFIRWIGLPLIDAGFILLCIWITKLFWYAKIKPDVKYIRETVVSTALVYTIIYIVTCFFIGLYDKPFKQKKLTKSAIISTLLLLAIYGLVPEQYRFSRGIIAGSAVLIFGVLTLFRVILIKLEVLDSYKNEIAENQTIIIGNKKDTLAIEVIYSNATIKDKILGNIATDDIAGTLGNMQNFDLIQKSISFKEIIYSASSLNYENIIQTIMRNKNKYQSKFYINTNTSIIGSDSKNAIGESITDFGKFSISSAASIRCKRILDFIASFLLLLFSPILYVVSRNKKNYFSNLFFILIGKKTFVGYNQLHNDLPQIKPHKFNNNHIKEIEATVLSEALLFQLDYRYAKNYSCISDMKIIWRYYFK